MQKHSGSSQLPSRILYNAIALTILVTTRDAKVLPCFALATVQSKAPSGTPVQKL